MESHPKADDEDVNNANIASKMTADVCWMRVVSMLIWSDFGQNDKRYFRSPL